MIGTDWTGAVAREIVASLVKHPSLESQERVVAAIRELIERHCQFEKDVAYEKVSRLDRLQGILRG